MTEGTAITALQRALSESREAKRQIHGRLAEIEAEAEALRSQLASLNALIEQTEAALRRALFPSESQVERPAPSRAQAEPPLSVEREEAEIEKQVATHRLKERASNVRFNDFRIPQAATIVLREAGCPLHVSEIYRRMADGGFEFRGQHQLITLAVSLSRSKRFRKVAPGTFELDPRYLAGQLTGASTQTL
jgi:hypothetical protein